MRNLFCIVFWFLFVTPQVFATGRSRTRIKDPNILDRTQEAISSQLYLLSNKLDSYFGNPRVDDRATGSRIRWNVSSKFTDRKDEEYDSILRAKIRLPYMQDRLDLVVETFNEQGEGNRDVVSDRDNTQQTLDDQSLGAAVRYFFRKDSEWKINVDGGIKFTLPPDPFTELKAERTFRPSTWEIRFDQSFFWFDRNGLGESTSITCDHTLTDSSFFRSDSEATWYRIDDIVDWAQAFSIHQLLTRRKAMIYNTGFAGDNEEKYHVLNYFWGVRFRQQIYRNWILFEIEPRMDYPRSQNWAAVPSIAFKFEFVFGDI